MNLVSLPSDDRIIVGDIFKPSAPGATAVGAGLLFVHGYASDRAGYANRAAAVTERLGWTCLTFDLGGHGQSAGELRQLRREDHVTDVIAAYDALASTPGVDPGRIGVCGASYGAYLSCLLLGERPVRRLLLRAPALYVDRDRPDPTGGRGHLRQLIDADAALRCLERFDGQTLILESEHDEVIPERSIAAYVAAARHATHHVLPGATHALVQEGWQAVFLDEILTWFADL